MRWVEAQLAVPPWSRNVDFTPDFIQALYGRHPARVLAFEEVSGGLDRAVAEGRVFTSRLGPLELFSYSRLCLFNAGWDLFSLVARGLILDRSARQVVATPFPKFFNYGEQITRLPPSPFEVFEKVDGSLGIIFHHDGQWRVSTRGALDSEQGAWATEYLRRQVELSALAPGTTYLAEIVYPDNRIVIPYDFQGLVLLAAYDDQGHELGRAALADVATAGGMRLARSHACDSLDQLLDVARALPRDQEGFVVRFATGLRVKIKGEQYCRIQRLMCNCTPLGLWQAMMAGDDLERIRADLPEEMHADFDAIRTLLERRLDDLVGEVRAAAQSVAHLSDKDLGLRLQESPDSFPECVRRFLFSARNRGFLEEVRRPGEWRRKAFMTFRPDANVLEGYRPSGAATRFAVEVES